MLTWKWVWGFALVVAIACCASNNWITVDTLDVDNMTANGGLTSVTSCYHGDCRRISYSEADTLRVTTRLLVLGMALKIATGLAAFLLLVMWVLPAKPPQPFAIAILAVSAVMLEIFVVWYVLTSKSGELQLRPPIFAFGMSALMMIGAAVPIVAIAGEPVAASTTTAPVPQCRSCGNGLQWVAEYQRWYCATEQRYV